VNSSKGKAKTGLFSYDSVMELNPKNMGNSTSFLPATHTTLSTKRFRSYGILKIDFGADFCFWIELQLNGTHPLGLRLPEILEVPNTITVANSLRFPMFHNTVTNG
jgi:hypothetical protein